MNVKFCVDECNPVECGDGLMSYGRKRRSVNITGAASIPEQYIRQMVYDDTLDQEVIYNDAPLYKEIYVESG